MRSSSLVMNGKSAECDIFGLLAGNLFEGVFMLSDLHFINRFGLSYIIR